jgi:LytR cell envelope-related transcriptional attenuator
LAVTLAFSFHNFVDKIGSYAGFAAILGLALFTLLLFAQARELKRLREWGAGAHDRIGELERRLAAALELARRAGAPPRAAGPTTAGGRPAARTAAVPARGPVPARTSSPTRLPLLPAAAVGLGGPALGSATMAIALPARPSGAAAPSVPDEVVAAPGVVAAPQSPAIPAPATAAAQGSASAPAPVTVVEPPAATNGHGDAPPDTPPPPARRIQPPPARAGGGGTAARRPPARTGARPAAAPLRARAASATPRGAVPPAVEPTHARRRIVALVGGLLALVLAVGAVIVIATSGGGGGSSSQTSAGTSPSPTTATRSHRSSSAGAAAPAHDHIQVAVLNGTPVPGLANTVANTLAGAGFVRGQVGNASSQNRSVTVVSYLGGQEAAAAEVAKTLNLQSDAVQPIDADTEASACSGGGGTCAPVVVTVGADREH